MIPLILWSIEFSNPVMMRSLSKNVLQSKLYTLALYGTPGQVFSFPYLLPSQLKKRPNDCLPDIKSCISYLDEECIRPICKHSELLGISYIAGPMDED